MKTCGAVAPIRVLQFTWRLSPGGGIAHVVRSLARGIDQNQFEAHLCTARPLDFDAGLPSVRLHSLDLVGSPSALVKARAMHSLREVTRAIQPHVVHVHSGVAWYSTWWRVTGGRSVPALLEIHDGPSAQRVSSGNQAVEGLMLRRLGYQAVAHSDAVRADLVSAYGLSPDDVEVVPIGIDTARFAGAAESRRAWRVEQQIRADATLVLSVSRLVRTKNPALFLEVAAEVIEALPGVVFCLVGEGPEEASLREQLRKRGLDGRIRIVGTVSDVAAAYRAADIYLSTSEYEGFGISILEAMAAAVPVVATRVGGVPELVDDGVTGRLAVDRSGLVHAVIDLVRDRHRRRQMGNIGRSRAARFTVDAMAARYENLYRRMCRSSMTRAR